jgi:hypothetical protein
MTARPREEPIPTLLAAALFAELKSWTKVARKIRRPSGQTWWPNSIKKAVERERARDPQHP